MSTSSEIKQRANALAEKTDVNSITPKEVGSIMYDLASHSENVLRNGGTLGIRKVYESVAAMEADSTNPIDIWGNPIKKGNLVVIYDGTTTGVDNNKIYAFMNPGWQIATHLDAGYATKAETDAKLAELGSKVDIISLIGANNEYKSYSYNGLISGRKYVVRVLNPNVDMSGVTVSGSKYSRLDMSIVDEQGIELLKPIVVSVGQDIKDSYYFTVPNYEGLGSAIIKYRATIGCEMRLQIEDITNKCCDYTSYGLSLSKGYFYYNEVNGSIRWTGGPFSLRNLFDDKIIYQFKSETPVEYNLNSDNGSYLVADITTKTVVQKKLNDLQQTDVLLMFYTDTAKRFTGGVLYLDFIQKGQYGYLLKDIGSDAVEFNEEKGEVKFFKDFTIAYMNGSYYNLSFSNTSYTLTSNDNILVFNTRTREMYISRTSELNSQNEVILLIYSFQNKRFVGGLLYNEFIRENLSYGLNKDRIFPLYSKYKKGYIATNLAEGEVVNINDVTEAKTRHCIIEINSGDYELLVGGVAESIGRLWAFIDSDYRVISKSEENAEGPQTIRIPEKAAYAILHSKAIDPSFESVVYSREQILRRTAISDELGGSEHLVVSQKKISSEFEKVTSEFEKVTSEFEKVTSYVESEVSKFDRILDIEYGSPRELTKNDADEILNKGISSSNLWVGQNNEASVVYEVKRGNVVNIKANEHYYTIYAFLKNTLSALNTSPNFADGEEGRHVIKAGTDSSIIVKDDCLLYIYYQTKNGEIYFPEKIELNTYTSKLDTLVEEISTDKISRYAVNLCDESLCKKGELDSDGNVKSGSSLVTDYIPLHIGDKWYQKTLYLHTGYAILKERSFAFGAEKVCFYNEEKLKVGEFENIESAIDKDEDVRYVRVQFPSNATNLYVATDNRTKLPSYVMYSQKMLTASERNYVDLIKNSDGAINNMLNTALDYVNNNELDLGYGDIATAFDDVVEPVSSEFDPVRYEGEKMQCDCSAFVELAFQGIRYKNSRYVAPEGINFVSKGYKFDSQAEFNYHNLNPLYTHICGADFGKMYANKLCKYAYDRGYLYTIKSDFSNVEVSDLIFYCNTYDDFFLNVGHVSFVSRILLNADMSKSVWIMEVSGTGIAKESVLNYRNGVTMYAARLPLPFIESEKINIVDTIEKNRIEAIPKGETKILATLNLKEQIKAHGIYTLVAECYMPEKAEIRVRCNGSYVGGYGESLYIRKDGIVEKHWHYDVNSSVNVSEIELVVYAHDLISENIELNDVKVFKEYITAT